MTDTGRGRTARVYTNETCNQNCAFCNRRAPRERPAFVDPGATRRRVDEAARAPTVVLTGGEPTLRRDLAALIEHARRRGARVELETNAALIDEARAAELAAAGLELARVHLPAWGAEADAISRDPGGFEATLRGARSLVDAGVALEVSAPVVRANAASLPRLPAQLTSSGLPIEALVIGVPVDAPDPSTLLGTIDAARVLERVAEAARRAGLTLRLDPHAPVPPCLLSRPARHAHLFSLTRGGRERPGYVPVSACARCAVGDRCPGVPAAHRDALEGVVEPIVEDRVRRRLSLISSVEDQVARELVQDEVQRRPNEPPRLARTVRINFRCNQACRFCFVSTHLPTAPDARVEAAIAEAARQGATIALSGGEPTLHPRVVDFVALAKREGASLVELQTNAIRLADEALVAALGDAGIDLVFVSLHGSSAALSDGITRAPGTFDRTVRGLDAVHHAGLRLRLSWVFCQANLDDFPRYVDWVADRWPGTEIGVSFVAPSTDLVPRTEDLVPRYTDVVPHLADGMRIAAARGVRLSGFESMCGLPLCLVPDDLSGYFELAAPPDGYDGGEVVRTEACARCELRGTCFGLRRGYAAIHGTDELRPVTTTNRQRTGR
ncbi:MAG TPA: radical SAM protein [Sandaracinaceae bacterium LLY-WYZ-13_1]|nr:radical SAM protein [Sandaracinaceae bacterium LLY-WYZ-13_1]